MRGSAWIGLYIVYGLVGREAASKTGASQKLQRKICSMSGRLASVVAQPEVLNSNYGDKIFRRLEIVCRAAFIAYEFIQNQREIPRGGVEDLRSPLAAHDLHQTPAQSLAHIIELGQRHQVQLLSRIQAMVVQLFAIHIIPV